MKPGGMRPGGWHDLDMWRSFFCNKKHTLKYRVQMAALRRLPHKQRRQRKRALVEESITAGNWVGERVGRPSR